MKKLLFAFIALLFLFGCYTPTQTFVASEISYEKTPAVLIQKSIQDLNLVKNLNKTLSKDDKIIIASMEKYETLDSALTIAVEDEFIKELVSNGHTVLERDHHSLKWLNNELEYYDLKGDDLSLIKNIEVNTINASKSNKAQLISGSKIISYRIIESGIIYKEKPLTPTMLDREARTILEIRVLNVKTGAILDALTLNGVASDEIKKQDVHSLNNYYYKHYYPTLPNTYQSSGEEIIIEKENVEKENVEKENNIKKGAILGASAAQLLIVLGGFVISLITLF